MTAKVTKDKVQIGLTPSGAQALDSIMTTGWFDDRQDAYRAAIAVALARGLVPAEDELTNVTTAYNFVGGIDKDGRVRALINALAPKEADRPASYAERLAHGGLSFMAERLADGTSSLSDVLL